MSRSAADSQVRASTIQDGMTTAVHPRRSRISARPAETTGASGRQERAAAADALHLIATRPDLARAAVRPFGVVPDHLLRPARRKRLRGSAITRTKDEQMIRANLRLRTGLLAAAGIGARTVIRAMASLAPTRRWPHHCECRCCYRCDRRPLHGTAIAEGPCGSMEETGKKIACDDGRVSQAPDEHFHVCSSAGQKQGRTLRLQAARGAS
jgi:hypothetical protein